MSPGQDPAAEWDTLERALLAVEQEYRRERVGPGGAPPLAPSARVALTTRLASAARLYTMAPPDVQARMRAFVAGTDRVARQLDAVVGAAIARVAAAPPPSQAPDVAGATAARDAIVSDALEALAAVALADGGRDFRDTLQALGMLWIALHWRGVAPAPLFERTAASVPAAPSRSGGMPTRELLAGFERSAYFTSAVAPRLVGR